MKTYKKYIGILAALAAMQGCYDLDMYPTTQISSGTFWLDEEDAKEGIMSVYANMNEEGSYGYCVLQDTYTDVAQGPGSAREIGTLTGADAHLVNNWQHTWEGVQRANHVIAMVSPMGEEKINPLSKARILGEAYFMRALYYFHLTDLFGDLPIYDESWEVTENFTRMYLPRSPQSDVWDFIISSLDKAVESLPVAWPASDYGRATKGAAYALRGKAKLWKKDYKGAIADFEEIVYNKTYEFGYTLYPNLMTLFLTAGPVPGDKETIFAIQASGMLNNNLGTRVNVLFGNRGTYLNAQATCTPSVDLADMYEYKDGKPFSWTEIYPDWDDYDPVTKTYPRKEEVFRGAISGVTLTKMPDTTALGKLYRSRDPRLCQTIIVPWSTYLGWSGSAAKNLLLAVADGGSVANGFIPQDRGYWTHYYRKFVYTGDLNGTVPNNRYNCPINVPLIRLADVLLMLSEAYNEDNQLDKAIIELNKVRARFSTGMPGLNSGPAWLAVGNKQQMQQRIIKERALELHGEGHRFGDLRRWGVAEDLLDQSKVRAVDGMHQFTRSFKERNYLWPLPTEELINCPNLLPNNNGW